MIDVIFEDFIPKDIHAVSIQEIAKFSLDYLGYGNHDVSIVMVSNERIRKLNLQYRNIDRSTDVLSFSFDHDNLDTGQPYLGDVVISGEKTIQQAKAFNHSFRKELTTLIVHGILHLVGFDDEEEIERKRMLDKQEEIIKEFDRSEGDKSEVK